MIFPRCNYNEALSAPSLATLTETRVHLSQRSTLQKYTTKTTRYTLFFLNEGKFSIIIISAQVLTKACTRFAS